jgi:hypothetical protein
VRTSKYIALLEDVSVKRWYDNVARGSRVTADVYLRRLGNFCHSLNITPSELLLLKERDIYNILLDTVSKMEKKGHAGSYIQSTLKAVKSWLSHNRVEVRGRIKIKGMQDTPTLKDERVPTRDELRRIFLAGDKKARVASVLIAHCGLRTKTVGNYRGDEGLRIKDLPEIVVKGETVEFEKVPTMVIVRKELSKSRHQYFTFISEEGCEYLKNYLESRIRQGEIIEAESAVVTPKQGMKSFITATNIGDVVRKSIRSAGFRWRPYVLRAYFDTQLMLAESKGLVLRDYRQFWMGHTGDIENRYTTNKCKIPESVIEDMREAYRRSQEYLQTTKVEETGEERLRQAFRKQLLLVAGFNETELEKMDSSSISDEELQTIIREKLLGTETRDCQKQKVVNVEEVESYLAQGWECIANLPNKKVLIKMSL